MPEGIVVSTININTFTSKLSKHKKSKRCCLWNEYKDMKVSPAKYLWSILTDIAADYPSNTVFLNVTWRFVLLGFMLDYSKPS